jgi:hypothetical protein
MKEAGALKRPAAGIRERDYLPTDIDPRLEKLKGCLDDAQRQPNQLRLTGE